MAPKTVILTGASRGIGLAIAHYLLKSPQSTNVVVVARSKAPLEDLKKQYPKQVEVLSGDLADFSVGQKAVDLAQSSFGQLDGLIINHGTLDPVKRIAELDPIDWLSTFNVNFFSAVVFVKAALPALRASKGCILLTSSGAAITGYSAWGGYGASKAALNHLALTLAVEEHDITSMAIRPGIVETQMQTDLREKHLGVLDKKDSERFVTAHKDGTLLKPEQPGHVIAKLALNPPHDLSGKFIQWNDKALEAYQS